MTLSLHAKSLKVTCVLDAAEFVQRNPMAEAGPRTILKVEVAGRTVTADVATKTVRKCFGAIAEHAANGVALVIQGRLMADGSIGDAGLSAMPRQPKPVAAQQAA